MDLFDDLPPPKATEATPPQNADTRKRVAEEETTSNGEVPKAKQVKLDDTLDLRVFFTNRQGERPEMEDAHQLIVDFRQHVKDVHPDVKRLAYFAVFDGHNGTRASQLAAAELHKHVATKLGNCEPEKLEREFKKRVVEAFREFDDAFLKQASKQRPVWKDGCTACVCIVINDTLFTANLGDTRAVLCTRKGHERVTVASKASVDSDNQQAVEVVQPNCDSAEQHSNSRSKASELEQDFEELQKLLVVQLSTDHSPLDFDERRRIQQAGGVVRNGRVNEILEVSRSFGDYNFKKSGVTYIPDVSKYSLSLQDKFLIIACDGLWKAVTNDEAGQSVWRFVNNEEQFKADAGTSERTTTKRAYEEACAELANQAVRKLTGDNVTVVIVKLHS